MTSLLTDWRDRPTHRRVWALAAPMILSNISVPLVALVDSMVIGHLPHAHQLGAVAVGASLYTFLAWAMGFLRMGSTGFAAQAAGRGEPIPTKPLATTPISANSKPLTVWSNRPGAKAARRESCCIPWQALRRACPVAMRLLARRVRQRRRRLCRWWTRR